jgi:hypothetical protein
MSPFFLELSRLFGVHQRRYRIGFAEVRGALKAAVLVEDAWYPRETSI